VISPVATGTTPPRTVTALTVPPSVVTVPYSVDGRPISAPWWIRYSVVPSRTRPEAAR